MPKLKTTLGTVSLLAAAIAASAASYHFLSSRIQRDAGGSGRAGSLSGTDSAGRGTPGSGVSSIAGGDGAGAAGFASTVEFVPPAGRDTYMVILSEDALASYKGGRFGYPMPKRHMVPSGMMRLDPDSNESRNYVRYLHGRQIQFERQMTGMIRRQPLVRQRMQHALNAIVTDLNPQEAARIRAMAGVKLVEQYREYELLTDTGPTLIGAPPVWNGSNRDAPAAYQGEGVVFGIIDTGVNFGSPSFAATDPIDGYVHVNPLGSGNYLGTCASGGVDAGRCNNKLIGGYDFVCGAPGNQCGLANVREEPGFGDTNGHGSHTASTAAGNRRDVTYAGTTRRISGVAPRGNIIAYDTCYTNTSTGGGSCPSVSTAAAVDQAIADGIVDVLNYSIAGGTSPWTEATSLAFLNAVNAGIYVATAAGNAGPGAGTTNHLSPWVGATAASQHGRGSFAIMMQVTGPAPVPPALSAPVVLEEGSGGVPHSSVIPGTTPMRISPGIDTTSDGCASFTPGTFAGAIAVVRRGTCTFTIKANNAAAAGAIATVIANNTTGPIAPSVPGATIPVFGATQADGNTLRDFGVANPTTATAQLGFPAVGMPNTPDALGDFSARGPAGTFALVKPDITAPGVAILAATSGTALTGSENAVAVFNGTSMASPHHAGAAGLVRQARPSWTVSEIKSALMMTSTSQVYLEDQVTPANPFARGAGRIRVDRAVNALLVLDETQANYQAANPTSGGNPANLNLASLGNGRCVPVCEFTRVFRSTHPGGSAWRVQFNGVPGTALPPVFWVPPGTTKSVKFVVDISQLPNNGNWNLGDVELINLRPGNQTDEYSALHLPVAVAVPPPVISVPASVSASIAAGGSGAATFNVGNIGGSVLNYSISNSGNGAQTLASAVRGGVSTGTRSTIYSDSANPPAQFSADDFTLASQTQLTTISVEGFTVSGAALTSAATALDWSIYPDSAGVPAGNPYSSPGAAVWTYSAAPTSPGVFISSGNFALNLAAAGQNVTLLPGRYWLVVNTRGTFANRWAWYGSAGGSTSFMTLSLNGSGVGTWTATTSPNGLAMRIVGLVACGAPWLGAATPPGGSVAPSGAQFTSVALNGAGMVAGSYRASVCVPSNDPVTPVTTVPIQLTVTP